MTFKLRRNILFLCVVAFISILVLCIYYDLYAKEHIRLADLNGNPFISRRISYEALLENLGEESEIREAAVKNLGFADIVVENISLGPSSDIVKVYVLGLPLTIRPGEAKPLVFRYVFLEYGEHVFNYVEILYSYRGLSFKYRVNVSIYVEIRPPLVFGSLPGDGPLQIKLGFQGPSLRPIYPCLRQFTVLVNSSFRLNLTLVNTGQLNATIVKIESLEFPGVRYLGSMYTSTVYPYSDNYYTGFIQAYFKITKPGKYILKIPRVIYKYGNTYYEARVNDTISVKAIPEKG